MIPGIVTIEWLTIIVTILSILVVVLIGWHIIDYWSFRKRIKKYMKKELKYFKISFHKKLNLEIDKNVNLLMNFTYSELSNFYYEFASDNYDQKEYSYSLHLFIIAISYCMKGNDIKKAKKYSKELLEKDFPKPKTKGKSHSKLKKNTRSHLYSKDIQNLSYYHSLLELFESHFS